MNEKVENFGIGKNIIDIIFFKAFSEIQDELSRRYLGILWWFIEPVLNMVAFYIVLIAIQGRQGHNIVQFLLIGMVVWRWFESSIGQGANSIIQNSKLIKQIYLPKFIFPCISSVTNLIKFAVVFSCLLVFLVITTGKPSWTWFVLPLIIAVQFLVQLALSALLSLLVPFVPDLKSVIDNLMVLVFFLSGIMYDVSHIPENLRSFLYLNPMIEIIKSYRLVLLNKSWPEWKGLFIIMVFSIFCILIVSILFRKFDKVIPKVMFQ